MLIWATNLSFLKPFPLNHGTSFKEHFFSLQTQDMFRIYFIHCYFFDQFCFSYSDRDFSIQVSTDRRSFTAGEPLELRCTIEAQNVPERFFSVSWVFSSSPVAVVGPSAVPILGPDYVAREAAGHMTVRKESANVHLLKLQHLHPKDAGKYICRVTEREKTPTGDFIDRSKRSRNVQISVQPLSE